MGLYKGALGAAVAKFFASIQSLEGIQHVTYGLWMQVKFPAVLQDKEFTSKSTFLYLNCNKQCTGLVFIDHKMFPLRWKGRCGFQNHLVPVLNKKGLCTRKSCRLKLMDIMETRKAMPLFNSKGGLWRTEPTRLRSQDDKWSWIGEYILYEQLEEKS